MSDSDNQPGLPPPWLRPNQPAAPNRDESVPPLPTGPAAATTTTPRPVPEQPTPTSRRNSIGTWVVLAVATLLVLWFAVPVTRPLGIDNLSSQPPPGTGSHAERLAPVVQPTTTGPHDFLQTDAAGQPITYSPCRVLNFVVNMDGAPPNSLAIVQQALDVTSAKTGLIMQVEGMTEEEISLDRPAYLPDQYGDRWAPILISWASMEQLPEMSGTVLGLGGSIPAEDGDGNAQLVSGAVTINQDYYYDRTPEYQFGVLLHEIGHVLGLGHVQDNNELMSPTTAGRGFTFGPGDEQGLARVGAGQCHATI